MRNKDVLKKLKNLPDNTKEYIDTNELVKVITDFELISTGKVAKIYTDSLTAGRRYRFPFESYPNLASAAIIKKYDDGTTKTITTIRKSTDYIYVSAIIGTFDIYHRSAVGTMSRVNGSFGTTSSEYTSTVTKVVLDTLSDRLFEPTKDYHPATKKYVDDKSPFKSITSTADNTIIINELQTDNLYELNGSFKMFPSSESVNISGLFIFENIDDNTKALRKINNNGNITTTSYVLNVNAQTYTINKTQEINYLTPESSCIYLENVRSGIYSTTALSARVNKSNNTSVALGVAGIKYLAITKASYNGDTIWSINVLGSIMSNSTLTLKSDGTVVKEYYQYQTDENVLTKINTTEYTPTEDYNPATKKYVDDATNTLVKKDTNKYILITNDDTLVIKKTSITDIANATVTIDNLTGKFGTLVANNDGTYSYTLNTIMTDVETFTFKVNNVEQKLVIVPYREMQYDDSNAAITYVDGWSIEKNEKCYNGNIHVVTSSDSVASKANFEFVGTGIEVFSLINNQTGRIQVAIWKQKDDGTYPKTAIYRKTINTNYTYSDATYAFPVISFDNNEYSKYKIEITVGKGETFYLDSICIHNPIYNLNLKIQNLYQQINENTNILYTNKHNPIFVPSRIYDPTTKKYVDELVENSKTAMCTDEEVDNMLNEVLGGDYSGN